MPEREGKVQLSGGHFLSGTAFDLQALRDPSPHTLLDESVGQGLEGFGARSGKLGDVLLFGIPFFGGGLWAMRCTTARQTLDAREGFCWKGSVSPSEDPNLVRQGKATALTDIHAVQLVAERLSSSDGRTDYSTEINLVLHDGSRRHLVDHGGGSISDDAERLARFLKVPVWSQSAASRPFDPERDPPFEQILRDRFGTRKSQHGAR